MIKTSRKRSGPMMEPEPSDTSFWRNLEIPAAQNETVVYLPVSSLQAPDKPLRRRRNEDEERLKELIARFRYVVPLMVSSDGRVYDGVGRLNAMRELGFSNAPVYLVDHMSEAERQALALALNRTAERGIWNEEALAGKFKLICRLDPTLLNFSGFSMPKIDQLLTKNFGIDEEEDEPKSGLLSTSRAGDLWSCGDQRLFVGNSREASSYRALLCDERVEMVCSDPPYPCKIAGHASSTHTDFQEGSGLDETKYTEWSTDYLRILSPYLQDGAVVDLCIDHLGLFAMMKALRETGFRQLSLCCWDKGAGAMGSLYRHQVEYIVISKWGRGRHINNIALGRHGRNRTTLWRAPGMAQFGASRKAALEAHPTVKPVSLFMEALLDTSRVRGVVLDPFVGSGTLLLAAHRTQRRGRGIELDPKYADVALRRLQREVGEPAKHLGTGKTLAEIEQERQAEPAPAQARVRVRKPEAV